MEKDFKDFSLFRKILQQAKPYRFKIVWFFFLSILATPLALLAPVPLKIVVDNVINKDEMPYWLDVFIPTSVQQSSHQLLLFSIFLFLFIAVFSSLHKLYTWNILHTKITENLLLDFRSRLLNYAQRLSIGFHDAKGISHASYRIHYDTFAIQLVIFGTIISLVSAILTFVAMMYIMLVLDSTLALLALVFAPFIFLFTELFRKGLRRGWTDYKNQDHNALSIINEVLSMLRVIKVFGREEYEGGRFLRTSQRAIGSRMKVAWLDVFLTFLIGLTTTAGTVLVLFIGTKHVMEGVLSLGSLLLIMSYLAQLYTPLKTIGSKVAGLQAQLTSAERAFSLLEHPLEVSDTPDSIPIKDTRGQIKFEQVSFSYNERHQVLKNISFEVRSGMRVGIAGRTGAGKSTLISLLFRFYDPDSGRILLDGRDIRQYMLKDYRKLFSFVLQDSLLFSGSISENIAYGAPGSNEKEIIRAAKVANAHEFITNLPEGYQTKAGEKGMKLSGGERQRIALARAFIADAPILVFDEPTSSVDTKTEAAIVDSMDRFMKGRTTFIIAHRLTTLERCDLLLIIEDGKIIKSTTNVKQTIREAILNGSLHVDAKGEFIDQ